MVTKQTWIWILLYALLPASTLASSKTPGKVIAGWIETISLPNHPYLVKAKLDTGANTSSIHAENIEPFKKDDKNWLKFDLVLTDNQAVQHRIPMERPRVRKVRIKNHDGNHDRRLVITLDLCFDGRQHNVEFNLANRTEYIYDVLLGREFLQHVAVVDPEETFLTQARCTTPISP